MKPEKDKYDVVVCGAGIAGIACAHALAVAGFKRVALVDHGPPLGLTSDKSTECYRNWWPGPGDAMVALMNRSIDLMEQRAQRSNNRFLLQRQGYVFATAQRHMIDVMQGQAAEAESLGAGPLRMVSNAQDYRSGEAMGFGPDGFDPALDGADLLTDPAMIRENFPYLSKDTIAVLHARRCGSLSAQQMGMYLLDEARAKGVELLPAKLAGIERSAGNVSGGAAGGQSGRETQLPRMPWSWPLAPTSAQRWICWTSHCRWSLKSTSRSACLIASASFRAMPR